MIEVIKDRLTGSLLVVYGDFGLHLHCTTNKPLEILQDRMPLSQTSYISSHTRVGNYYRDEVENVATQTRAESTCLRRRVLCLLVFVEIQVVEHRSPVAQGGGAIHPLT